jgi:hypothetical protein
MKFVPVFAFTGMLVFAGEVLAEGVKVPCGSAETGLNDCTEVKNRSVDLVTKRAKEIVEEWYQGKGFYPRTCSLKGNLFTGNLAEVDTNHRSQSCGEWSKVRTSYRVQRKKFSVRVDSSSTIDSTGDFGNRERAYTAGAYVQAVDFVLQKINAEIREGSLNMQACKSLGAKAGQSVTQLISSFKSFSSHVEGGKARELLDKCDKDQSKNEFTDGQGKGEAMDQVNCRLAAQRAATESLFEQFAICELMLQSKAAFDEFRLDTLDPEDMYRRINGWVQASKGCGANDGCQNSRYQQQYTEYFKSKLDQHFGRSE